MKLTSATVSYTIGTQAFQEAGSRSVDQNTQFIIIVGTVIGVFLWLRNDINRLDKEISSLRKSVSSLQSDMTSVRESIAWMRGRMGYSETPTDTEDQPDA